MKLNRLLLLIKIKVKVITQNTEGISQQLGFIRLEFNQRTLSKYFHRVIEFFVAKRLGTGYFACHGNPRNTLIINSRCIIKINR